MDPVDTNAKWDIASRLHNWTETRESFIRVVIKVHKIKDPSSLAFQR